MKRRDFIKLGALTTAAFLKDRVWSKGLAAEQLESVKVSNAAKLPHREYGNTGVKLSVIGLGGIVVSGTEQKHANRVVAEMVERGVNYFDFAPTYGNAEERLGPALQPYRKDLFLACKTTERSRKGAQAELKRSLERLGTDHFDLYQLHAIIEKKKDVEASFSKGGAMEAFIEAKKSGQVRYLGFSAHTVEAALAAMDLYDFDSVLFPINFACYYKGNFGPQVIAKAQKKGVALLALKALARQKWPEGDTNPYNYKCSYQPLSDLKEAELGLRFTLGQPVTAAIPPGDELLFRLALALAMNLTPLTASEENQLRTLSAKLNPVFQRG